MARYEEILHAHEIISPHILRTPLVYSPTFSEMTGARVYLKLETLQKAGSFKVRGAIYRILSHLDAIAPAGVIAASAGNHAQGVAVAARIAKVPATIVMPRHASLSKQGAARSYGAAVVLAGENLQESIEIAKKQAERSGATFIHPYNDPDIIAGQGTVGIEILEDLPSPGMVIVPVGGGGLVTGIATVFATVHPQTRVIGVQAEACPSAYDAIRQGRITTTEPRQSVSDGILVPRVGDLTLPAIQSLVHDIVLVNEEETIAAMLLLLERKKIIAEGAGAVPLAALLNGRIPIPSDTSVVLVISGGNIDSPLLARVIERGLVQQGRILPVAVLLRDIPGSLASLLSVIAGEGGNIIHVGQRRDASDIPFDTVVVDLTVETHGRTHGDLILERIGSAGFVMR